MSKVEQERISIAESSPLGSKVIDLKEQFALTIKEAMKRKKLTIRKVAELGNTNHPQILRVTGCENYTIDTLQKVAVALDLELVLRPKEEEKQLS